MEPVCHSPAHMVSKQQDRHPGFWRSKPALQQVQYADKALLQSVLEEIALMPPLVTSFEIEALREHLAQAACGRRFLLQGGDCAEQFADCQEEIIKNRLKILLQMSVVLAYGLQMPVVRVGRFAGQYAKPRSKSTETREGVTLPAYRGDNINGPAFTARDRMPDPKRLIMAYHCSAVILNLVRSLGEGGFADLHNVDYWDLDFAQRSPLFGEYHAIIERMRGALRFAEAVSQQPIGGRQQVKFFTCHEALHLPYEEALTRPSSYREGMWMYNLATHFPWIGMRTLQHNSAHVAYMRSIRNPIGIKVGPELSPSELASLIHHLNPEEMPGRLTLITRLGVTQIERLLPPMVEAVCATGQQVLWCCDPMHGNTERTKEGYKTRRFDNILGELELAFNIHGSLSTTLGGVHFELTGEDVTECIGGARGIDEADLQRAYHSRVDPRLNAEQSLEMALHIVGKHEKKVR